MKASMKFREAQKPLFRAKLPLKFLGFPFQSGIVAGESKELRFNLTTSLESGPSLKVAYRSNDSFNPISVVFKTGTRHFRSPICTSFNMRAEFNLIGGCKNPSFFVHFKPHLGDLIVDLGKKNYNSPLESPAAGVVLSDVEMTVTMDVPLRKTATLNFVLSVRVPTMMVLMNNSMTGISVQKLLFFIINKIGIDCRVRPASIDAAEVFLGVKKQLEMIKAENGALKKAMDNLKGEIFNRLEITQADNGTSKKAVDYLYCEFITNRVFRLLEVSILNRTQFQHACLD